MLLFENLRCLPLRQPLDVYLRIRPARDSEVGRPSGIVQVIDETTLCLEGEAEGRVESGGGARLRLDGLGSILPDDQVAAAVAGDELLAGH